MSMLLRRARVQLVLDTFGRTEELRFINRNKASSADDTGLKAPHVDALIERASAMSALDH